MFLSLAGVLCLSLLASSCNLLIDLLGEPPQKYEFNQEIDLELSLAETGVLLRWTPVNGADEYCIKRLHFPEIPFGENASSHISTRETTWHDTEDIVAGQVYRYEVWGIVYSDNYEQILLGTSDTESISIPVPVNSLPSQPQGLSVRAADGSIVLSWTSAGEGLVYDVYYAFESQYSSIPYPGAYVLNNWMPLTVTSCIVNTEELPLTYYSGLTGYLYFYVVATDPEQNSSYPSLPVRIAYTAP